jgi:CxxC motif-containing protein
MSNKACDVTCIVCPTGCRVHVIVDGDGVIEVSGNSCRRGTAYASQEAIAPQRTLTTSVRVIGGDFPLASVKSVTPVPKARLFDLVRAARLLVTAAPVHVGDVVAKDVLGLGIDLVATREVGRTS